MEYPIVIEKDPEAGGYVVFCPTLKGCVSQGETEEEALENIKDAIKTYLESVEDLVPRHHVIKPGTLKQILDAAEISPERFKELT